MAVIYTDVLTASPVWIVGLLGITAMAFFLGCAGCRQHKSHAGADRRPPPPTPEINHQPRYQGELYSPAAPSPAAHTFPSILRENDNDYEDDFEELPSQVINDQLNKNIQCSAASPKTTRVAAMGSSIESEGMESHLESRCPSYENLVTSNKSPAPAPVMGKDHTYLEVFPSNNEMDLELAMADKGSIAAMRSSVESEGKVSILSQSSQHSYENVVNTNGSPSSAASELEGDYVNLMHE